MNKTQKKALKEMVKTRKQYLKVLRGKSDVPWLETEIKHLTTKLAQARILAKEEDADYALLLEGIE